MYIYIHILYSLIKTYWALYWNEVPFSYDLFLSGVMMYYPKRSFIGADVQILITGVVLDDRLRMALIRR